MSIDPGARKTLCFECKRMEKTANAPQIIFLFSLAVTHQFTHTQNECL